MNSKSSEILTSGTDTVKGYFEPIKEKTEKWSVQLADWTRKNPIVAASVALGVGFVCGSFFRKRKAH